MFFLGGFCLIFLSFCLGLALFVELRGLRNVRRLFSGILFRPCFSKASFVIFLGVCFPVFIIGLFEMAFEVLYVIICRVSKGTLAKMSFMFSHFEANHARQRRSNWICFMILCETGTKHAGVLPRIYLQTFWQVIKMSEAANTKPHIYQEPQKPSKTKVFIPKKQGFR